MTVRGRREVRTFEGTRYAHQCAVPVLSMWSQIVKRTVLARRRGRQPSMRSTQWTAPCRATCWSEVRNGGMDKARHVWKERACTYSHQVSDADVFASKAGGRPGPSRRSASYKSLQNGKGYPTNRRPLFPPVLSPERVRAMYPRCGIPLAVLRDSVNGAKATRHRRSKERATKRFPSVSSAHGCTQTRQ